MLLLSVYVCFVDEGAREGQVMFSFVNARARLSRLPAIKTFRTTVACRSRNSFASDLPFLLYQRKFNWELIITIY